VLPRKNSILVLQQLIDLPSKHFQKCYIFVLSLS